MRNAHPSRSLIRLARHSISSFTFFFLSSPTVSLSSLRTLSLIMSETSENISTDATAVVDADEDVKYGFQRSEMFQSKLSGTVGPYGRHVFLCYKTYDSWPSRVEDSESDPLPKLFAGALKARGDDINVKTRLTVCEGHDGTELSDGDVLVFPEMIKYRGLKESDVDGFVEDVLVNGKPWTSGVQEVLTGSHVFVCAHNNRDRRCGVCGPALIEKFKEEIELRDLKDQVFVAACSHVGGHKYAGNLIIFSANPEGKISGHWFGYVTPNDVPELLDEHIGKGEIIERLWRGQMGVYVEEAEKVDDKNLPNGIDLMNVEKKSEEIGNEEKNLPNGIDLTNVEKKSQEIGSEEKEESVASCCQGANGFSCCRDDTMKEKQGKKELGRLACWMGKLEQPEVLAAVAVVGAVATVAVAYSFYRRSS